MKIKEFIEGFYKKKHFWPRLVAVVVSVIVMGFCLSFLLNVAWGTDPCTLMNKSVSAKLGMTLGNWQALFNTVLLILVIIFGGRNIGFGTLANMFLVGYSIDFFSWVWKQVFPAGFFEPLAVKIVVFIPALIVFVIAAAIYMDMDMGTAPYDAIPFMISERITKISFRWIRMIFDFSVIAIGVLFGGKLQIVTVLMALMLGPVIGYIGKLISKKWDFT